MLTKILLFLLVNFETGSRCVARLASNLQSSCLGFLRAGIIGMHIIFLIAYVAHIVFLLDSIAIQDCLTQDAE
jgi:hypothetical protein